jgi:hypothetical protein
MSIYGWSIAHRAFELDGTDAKLGPAVCPLHPKPSLSQTDKQMWMGLTAAILTVV